MFINYKSEIYALARLNLSTASLKCLKLCKNSPALCFFVVTVCKRFHCLQIKYTAHYNVRSQLQQSDVIMWALISTVTFNRKDWLLCDAERDLLAVAKFLIAIVTKCMRVRCNTFSLFCFWGIRFCVWHEGVYWLAYVYDCCITLRSRNKNK